MIDAEPGLTRGRLRRLWDARVYPGLVDRVCATSAVTLERRRWVGRAHGHVLEVGIGSGLNLDLFDPASVTELAGIDPSSRLLARAAERAARTAIPTTLHAGVAQRLPFAAASFDTVVFSYTLCSVADPMQALAEARRVMAPGGMLLVIEHGRSRDPAAERWQRRLTPVWKRVAGNCHLDRDIAGLVEAAGFTFDELDARRDPTGSPLSFAYSGVASVSAPSRGASPSRTRR